MFHFFIIKPGAERSVAAMLFVFNILKKLWTRSGNQGIVSFSSPCLEKNQIKTVL